METGIQQKQLTDAEKHSMQLQNTRLVTEHKAKLLEINAKKHWDLFYKRNENRFFKDRHWTTREFSDLININNSDKKVLFEIGCGVGNLIFPLIEKKLNYFFFACDFSTRAVDIFKQNKLYDEQNVKAFQADITTDDIFKEIAAESVDVCTLIFVLSAIHPDKFLAALWNIFNCLKPGGMLLFRDYGLHDMAQVRFKPGHKIDENFYMRQDGTRSYYFSTELVENLFRQVGFKMCENNYVYRRTVNKKEDVDVERVFVQAGALKPGVVNKAQGMYKFVLLVYYCIEIVSR